MQAETEGSTGDSPSFATRAGAAALAALCVAAVRVALVAVWQIDGAEVGATRALAVARVLVESFAIVWGVALAWTFAPRNVAFRIVAGLALAALGALFATHRLPVSMLFRVPASGTAGLAVHGAAAVLALLAVIVCVVRVPGRRIAGGLALLVAAAAAFAVVAVPRGGASWQARPNLILVSLDTLRPDHLGCYGYERETSPELDRFAERSLRFDRAYTPQAFTLTAHMTMLTGLQPRVHGLAKGLTLSPEVRTLAGELGLAGYATLALVDDCMWLDKPFGFARGFDAYHRVAAGAQGKVPRVVELLDRFGRDRPYFLFAHFYDAHSDVDRLPYEGAPEDMERFASWYEGEFDGCDDKGRCASRFLQAANKSGWQPTEEERRWIISLYDAGIRTLDRQVGRLVDALEQRGDLERSVVIVTADHGEAFWEHGSALHGLPYDSCLRIPFLVRTPGTSGGASDALVSLVDVMPTLIDFAGLEAIGGLGGRSLAPIVRGELDDFGEPRVLTSSTETLVTGLRVADFALVKKGASYELFATDDVDQQRDLAGDSAHADVLATLREVFEARVGETEALRALLSAESTGREMTDEERESLQDLGYLGE